MFLKIKPLINKDKIQKVSEFYNQFHQAQVKYFEFWKENTFMKWDFWTTLALTIVPWILWAKFHKKQSRHRLLYVAFFVIIISSFLDFLGVVFAAWIYTAKVIPIIPNYIPWDFTLLPVTIISFIEYKPHISPWIKGVVFAAITAFVGESLFELVGFYYELKWSKLYSFPIYIVIYLLADWLSKREYFDKIK